MSKSKQLMAATTLGLALLFAACGPDASQQTAETSPPPTAENDRLPARAEAVTPPVRDARGDSTITLPIPAGDSSVVMLGELKSLNQHITVRVPVQDKHHLTASLLPLDSLRNIHFGQVVYPDGKKEGPFGKDISVDTSQNGNYQLIIAHSLMAEGGLAKEFKLRVTLTR